MVSLGIVRLENERLTLNPGSNQLCSDCLRGSLSGARTRRPTSVFCGPGQAGTREVIYPLIAAVTGPILTFAPPAFFGAYSRNCPLPRSMARDPSPTLKIVFSPRRVIV